jgi:hypothetical protein
VVARSVVKTDKASALTVRGGEHAGLLCLDSEMPYVRIQLLSADAFVVMRQRLALLPNRHPNLGTSETEQHACTLSVTGVTDNSYLCDWRHR